jgi:uncharacterized RDD family membrane protein YckC
VSDQPQYPSYPGPEQPAGQQPPPPPGYQPPPPPGYGQQAYAPVPPGQAGGHPGQAGGATPSYAGWWSRVGASIIDALIGLAVLLVPVIVGAIIAFKDAETDPVTDEITGGVNGAGIALMVLGYLLAIAFAIWNAVFRQGRTGQTLGKKVVGIQVLKADTGQVLGAGTGFLRWLMAGILGGLCFLDYLWPLWDSKKQTWHDMIAGSVVVTK